MSRISHSHAFYFGLSLSGNLLDIRVLIIMCTELGLEVLAELAAKPRELPNTFISLISVPTYYFILKGILGMRRLGMDRGRKTLKAKVLKAWREEEV